MIKSRYLNRNYIEPFGMVLKRTKIQVKPKIFSCKNSLFYTIIIFKNNIFKCQYVLG